MDLIFIVFVFFRCFEWKFTWLNFNKAVIDELDEGMEVEQISNGWYIWSE